MPGKEARERDPETALTNHIQKFILELGQGFAVANLAVAEAGIKKKNKLRRDKTQHEFWESFPDDTEVGTFLLVDVAASERIPGILTTPNPVTKRHGLPPGGITAPIANKRNTTRGGFTFRKFNIGNLKHIV